MDQEELKYIKQIKPEYFKATNQYVEGIIDNHKVFISKVDKMNYCDCLQKECIHKQKLIQKENKLHIYYQNYINELKGNIEEVKEMCHVKGDSFCEYGDDETYLIYMKQYFENIQLIINANVLNVAAKSLIVLYAAIVEIEFPDETYDEANELCEDIINKLEEIYHQLDNKTKLDCLYACKKLNAYTGLIDYVHDFIKDHPINKRLVHLIDIIKPYYKIKAEDYEEAILIYKYIYGIMSMLESSNEIQKLYHFYKENKQISEVRFYMIDYYVRHGLVHKALKLLVAYQDQYEDANIEKEYQYISICKTLISMYS